MTIGMTRVLKKVRAFNVIQHALNAVKTSLPKDLVKGIGYLGVWLPSGAAKTRRGGPAMTRGGLAVNRGEVLTHRGGPDGWISQREVQTAKIKCFRGGPQGQGGGPHPQGRS